MTASGIVGVGLRRIGSVARSLPGVTSLRRRWYETGFARGHPVNGYSGVYRTFEEALAAAPRGRPVGYDHAEMATLYDGVVGAVRASDYAVLFWLSKALDEARHVFDLGGHVGLGYYGYGKYLRLSPELVWTVCDVPAVVRQGRELATRRGATALRFTTRYEDIAGADVLHAAGSLQYLEPGFLPRLLSSVQERPRHVFVQRTPLHPRREFITLQATGPTFCPYTVAHRETFVNGLAALGYEVVDEWRDDRRLEVPFVDGTRIDHYTGLYFRRRRAG
jgi:putative methyltransferase (TIGR04325 family)